jgi:hypothetical protein
MKVALLSLSLIVSILFSVIVHAQEPPKKMEVVSIFGGMFEMRIPKNLPLDKNENNKNFEGTLMGEAYRNMQAYGFLNISMDKLKPHELSRTIEENTDTLADVLLEMYPTLILKNKGIVEQSGKRFGFIEMGGTIEGMAVSSINYLYLDNGTLVSFEFQNLMVISDAWVEAGKEMMQSIKVNW